MVRQIRCGEGGAGFGGMKIGLMTLYYEMGDMWDMFLESIKDRVDYISVVTNESEWRANQINKQFQEGGIIVKCMGPNWSKWLTQGGIHCNPIWYMKSINRKSAQ